MPSNGRRPTAKHDAAEAHDETEDETISLEEIEQLIAAASETSEGAIGAGPQAFDFRRPNKFSREHIRALQIVHETFARQFGTILSTTLRTVSQVSLKSVDQLSYDEYVRTTPNPSLLALLSLDPLAGVGILQVPIPVAMAAVDRLLGGNGAGTYPNRALTDIEANLMRELIERALRELTYAFESLVELDAKIVQLESNPQFAQIAAPSDMVVVMAFDTRIGPEAAGLTLCIPFASLQPVLEKATSHSLYADRGTYDPAAVERALTARLEGVAVEVSVRFPPVTLTSGEIVALRSGDVLPLHHDVEAPLSIAAAGVPLFAAAPGRKGKRLACRIVDRDHEEATTG